MTDEERLIEYRKKVLELCPFSVLFENPDGTRIDLISKDLAKKYDWKFFDGAPCEKCKSTIRYNGDFSEFANSKHHYSCECMVCHKSQSKTRNSSHRDYYSTLDEEEIAWEKQKHAELYGIRMRLAYDRQEKCHIHHIIPVYMADEYEDPELNESVENKIVVTLVEHNAIHTLIRNGKCPYEAIRSVVTDDIRQRMVVDTDW